MVNWPKNLVCKKTLHKITGLILYQKGPPYKQSTLSLMFSFGGQLLTPIVLQAEDGSGHKRIIVIGSVSEAEFLNLLWMAQMNDSLVQKVFRGLQLKARINKSTYWQYEQTLMQMQTKMQYLKIQPYNKHRYNNKKYENSGVDLLLVSKLLCNFIERI